ncbi:cytidine deaminase [Mesomycoplasma molare]|uniref:Cytidine deaminase n=1 Tax=Mesomycoplasma molare TaxID=171288 RepID=A0ABY5TWG6_9BACT|nr:cytidine deaminase [Mesomycoplasma molare]UWD34540.1 cytidine deaminase [Mesomycoplasma molare]
MYLKLKKLLDNAYAPYSNFPVAAILKDKDEKEWNGVNVENAAYPSGLCAERSALFGAISYGFKPKSIVEIHIISKKKDFIAPCAGCRQVMTELMPQDAKVFQYGIEGQCRVNTVKELVPYWIAPEDIIA